MAATRVISVIGKKNAGKTTLVVALAKEFVRRNRRVATLKHGHHPALADSEGKDTWRHYNEGLAAQVMIESPGHRVLFERTQQEEDPETLIQRYLSGADIVIVEGFKKAPLPKIEVFRKAEHPTPVFDAARPDARFWVAIVTDEVEIDLQVPCPVFRFADTSWLVTLATLAWDRAKPLTS